MRKAMQDICKLIICGYVIKQEIIRLVSYLVYSYITNHMVNWIDQQ